MVITYQEFEECSTIEEGIKKAISSFDRTTLMQVSSEAWRYYSGDNVEIEKRRPVFYNERGELVKDIFKANNKVSSSIFQKIIKQENSYLLSNGITMSEGFKDNLSKTFDNKMFECGLSALLDGVAWIYNYVDGEGKVAQEVFKGCEFVPLNDEIDNNLIAGIRRIKRNEKLTIYEFYEADGKTVYVSRNNGAIALAKPKVPYTLVIKKDVLGEVIEGYNPFGGLAIFPMYGNELRISEFKKSIKSKIDLIDIIVSDFGNNLEDSQDVYWVIENYAGQGLGEFLQDYKKYKSIKVNSLAGERSSATPHTIEVPYQARKVAIDELRRQIYEDSMALDTSILSGGSITNSVIKVMMADLNLKLDSFEFQVLETVNAIVGMVKAYKNIADDVEIKIVRRSLVNDTEVIADLATAVGAGIMSVETAIDENPYVEDTEEELKRIEEEGKSIFNEINKSAIAPVEEEEEEEEIIETK